MQRFCRKLGSLSQTYSSLSPTRRFLHSSPQLHRSNPQLQHTAYAQWSLRTPFFNSSLSHNISLSGSRFSPSPLFLLQVRHVSSRDRRKKRKPTTPVTSKVKKVKMKFYSSYKSRFRTLSDGTIRRWREGKNHNAHLKSKKSIRRLRRPSTVPVAYAKVMKKLSFCA